MKHLEGSAFKYAELAEVVRQKYKLIINLLNKD